MPGALIKRTSLLLALFSPTVGAGELSLLSFSQLPDRLAHAYTQRFGSTGVFVSSIPSLPSKKLPFDSYILDGIQGQPGVVDSRYAFASLPLAQQVWLARQWMPPFELPRKELASLLMLSRSEAEKLGRRLVEIRLIPPVGERASNQNVVQVGRPWTHTYGARYDYDAQFIADTLIIWSMFAVPWRALQLQGFTKTQLAKLPRPMDQIVNLDPVAKFDLLSDVGKANLLLGLAYSIEWKPRLSLPTIDYLKFQLTTAEPDQRKRIATIWAVVLYARIAPYFFFDRNVLDKPYAVVPTKKVSHVEAAQIRDLATFLSAQFEDWQPATTITTVSDPPRDYRLDEALLFYRSILASIR